MLPLPLQQLAEYFEKFPGVGPRQARRFAFFIMKQDGKNTDTLIKTLQDVKNQVAICKNCYLPTHNTQGMVCDICGDAKRDARSVLIVERESDALNMERTRAHAGQYFVLGDNISPIEKTNIAKERLKILLRRLKKAEDAHEIVLALNNTREGNFTALYVQELFKKNEIKNVRLTRLGRGLATGNEIEYLDEETLKNDLEGRK